MFHELLPGARIWNVATDKWTPHPSRTRPSFSPLSYSSYSFIRACVVWKSANALQRMVMNTSLKEHASYFYGKQRSRRVERWVSQHHTPRGMSSKEAIWSPQYWWFIWEIWHCYFSHYSFNILQLFPVKHLTCTLLSLILWGRRTVIIFSLFVFSTSGH